MRQPFGEEQIIGILSNNEAGDRVAEPSGLRIRGAAGLSVAKPMRDGLLILTRRRSGVFVPGNPLPPAVGGDATIGHVARGRSQPERTET